MKRLFHLLPVLVVLLTSVPTSAQSDSAIFGTVIDAATRKPLMDVVVILRSPALKQEEVVVTNAQGDFRFPRLPPGRYSLRFEQVHYHPHVREDLQLREGRSLRAYVALAWDPDEPVIW